ncbi:MAG TPA: hypothetical protein QF753_08825 [Victivallales bacterium]|nr:hypothetical protein [Victivallales bacterium]
MRKSIITLYFIMFSILTFGNNFSTADVKKKISEDIHKQIDIAIIPIHTNALQEVFSAKFYKAKININYPGSPFLSLDYAIVYDLDNKIHYFEMPTSNQTLTQMLSIINKNFRLEETTISHTLLEIALNDLEPIGTRDLRVEKIQKNGNKWVYIRSKFFDHYSGYIFYTDNNGKIVNIEYSMNIGLSKPIIRNK